MLFSSVHARFMKVLLPLVILCFALIAGVGYFMAGEMLTEDAIALSRSVSSKTALRMQLSIDQIHLPLNLAVTHHAILSAEESEILAFLSAIRQSSPLIAQTFLIRPDGTTLRADGVHLDRSSREYFQRVRQTKQPYISKPFLGETTRKMQTMVLQPILEEGRLLGILMASIHLSTLAEEALQEEVVAEEALYITDGDGFVVGSSEDGAIATVLSDRVASPELAAAFREAITDQRQTVVKYRAADATERFATVTPFELSGNRWAIVSSCPLYQVTAPARRLLRVTVAIFLASLLLGVLIIRRFARTIAAPLQDIAQKFQEIQESHGGRPTTETPPDEIGVLASGVAEMRVMHDQRLQFEQKASSDDLTGLLNRFGFKRQIRAAIAENDGCAAILAFADLDHLKDINDRIGHAAGDDAIVTAAHLLRQGFGEAAIIGRVGGDEFILFCCEKDGARDAIGKTRALMARYNENNQKPYYVELSIGIVEFTCGPGVTVSELMQKADARLYEAKKHRRDTSVREMAGP